MEKLDDRPFDDAEDVRKALKWLRTRDVVEGLMVGRTARLPDLSGSFTTQEEITCYCDPDFSDRVLEIIRNSELREYVETFITEYNLFANGKWNRNGRQGECPELKDEDLEWDRQKLEEMFLEQYHEWQERVILHNLSVAQKIADDIHPE